MADKSKAFWWVPIVVALIGAAGHFGPTIVHSWDKEKEEPTPPLDGIWNLEMDTSFRIVWEMKMSQEGDNIYAKGTKTSVLGKPATQGERNTTLELHGTINGNKVAGYYTETQTRRESSGKFTFELSEDRIRLSGNMAFMSPERF